MEKAKHQKAAHRNDERIKEGTDKGNDGAKDHDRYPADLIGKLPAEGARKTCRKREKRNDQAFIICTTQAGQVARQLGDDHIETAEK